MTSPDSRQDALKILLRWFSSDLYIDHILKNHSDLLSLRNRRFRDALIHRTLQWQRQLDYILSLFLTSDRKPPRKIYILLLMGAAELLHMSGTKDHGTVHSMVSLAGYHKKFVNALFRRLIQFRDSGQWAAFLKDKTISPGIRHSFPDWLTERWKNQFGRELERLLESLNRPPARMVRLMDEGKREAVIGHLKESDQFLGIHPDHRDFFVVRSIQPVPKDPFFQEGTITIQDVSSSLPEYFFPEKDVKIACDVCSAPGGKTAALLKSPGITGEIHAYDSDAGRLKQVGETLTRLKFNNFTLDIADARTYSYPPAELFLVDAPCSGFGVIRKRSDLRWRRSPQELEELVILQREILNNVSRYVRPSGRIIYSTCTFDERENLSMLQAFLKDHPAFAWCEPSVYAPENWRDERYPVLRTFPHLHDCEGSFAAGIKRT
jgi:16S rRNA (cytosine967-C5)-methyltransferase